MLTSLVDAKVLTTAPVFRGLTDTERDQILSGATVQRYKAGVTVFEQGELATRFYVLVSGRLRVTQLSEEGEQTIVRIVNPGDCSA